MSGTRQKATQYKAVILQLKLSSSLFFFFKSLLKLRYVHFFFFSFPRYNACAKLTDCAYSIDLAAYVLGGPVPHGTCFIVVSETRPAVFQDVCVCVCSVILKASFVSFTTSTLCPV